APALIFLVAQIDANLGRDLCLGAAIVLGAGLLAIRYDWMPPFTGELYGVFHWLLPMQVIMGLAVLGLGLAAAIRTRKAFTEKMAMLFCGVFVLVGLSLYLYVPIISMTNPPMNWGYPRTVTGFLHVLSRGQYERIHPTGDVLSFLRQAW